MTDRIFRGVGVLLVMGVTFGACAPFVAPASTGPATPQRVAATSAFTRSAPPARNLATTSARRAGGFGEIPGILRSTVGFVVPMPGTEMIRVGVVQEGATLQAANRNPGLEGTNREGVSQAKQTTVIIRVLPPGN